MTQEVFHIQKKLNSTTDNISETASINYFREASILAQFFLQIRCLIHWNIRLPIRATHCPILGQMICLMSCQILVPKFCLILFPNPSQNQCPNSLPNNC